MKTTKFGVLNNFNDTSRDDQIFTSIAISPMIDADSHGKKVQKILIADIMRKYNLIPNQGNSKRLHNYSIDVLRSLLVFGDHEHIIDAIRTKQLN